MEREVLLWLAESHRNFDLAGPGLTESALRDLCSAEPWTQGLAYVDFPIPYEPRSLAKSPDSTRIVVGTKAGYLCQAHWKGDRWDYKQQWYLGAPGATPEGGEKIARSIRAVRFLDDLTLVAGWGEGVFGIFDAKTLQCTAVVRAEPVGGSFKEHPWLGRFARFVSLVPPLADSSNHQGAVMMGATVGSRVHILSRDGGAWLTSTHDYPSKEILEGWQQGARVVDGVWSHDRLWLLDSSGHIYRFARREDGSGEIPLDLDRPVSAESVGQRRTSGPPERPDSYTLYYPRETGEFRCIASCAWGLAVLTSDDVTFLRFRISQEAQGPPEIIPRQARWVPVPGAIDCSVCLPFYDDGIEPVRQPVTRRDPVWMVVGTSQPGLHWIAWTEAGGEPILRLPAVSYPHRAGSGDTSVLQVRFGCRNRRGPTFLVCSTRDHHLRMSALLDRHSVEDRLQNEIPGALAEDSVLRHKAGIAWWIVRQRIRADFGNAIPLSPAIYENPKELLRFAKREDLLRLSPFILKQWERSPFDAWSRREILRNWIYLLLARAYQTEKGLAQELARLVYGYIAQMRQQDGVAGSRIGEELGLFTAFLRKWGAFGYTYGEKKDGLLELVRWNDASGHDLDALTYLTRLLRLRADPVWEVPPAPGVASSATWDVVAPPSGHFAIQSCTDGRISAVSGEGMVLPWHVDHHEEDLLETTHFLGLSQGSLRHRLAEKFLKKYWHGPYARTLLLSSLSDAEAGPYLLVFCLRGWRPEDRDEVAGEGDPRPRLYALLVQPGEDRMEILAFDSQPVPSELYGLCELPALGQRGSRHVIVAGTRGAWRQPGGLEERPFIEFDVEIGRGGESRTPDPIASASTGWSIRLDVETKRELKIHQDERGGRSVLRLEEFLPESAQNPCWSLASYLSGDGELFLWAGFHDGRIRCFLRERTPGSPRCWIEGGSMEPAQREPQETVFTHRESGLTTSAPVWRLHVLQQQNLLAYGSAEGIIGVVSLTEARDRDQRLRTHLVHSRESSPICGLLSYTEPEGGARLLALSQNGIAVIFDVAVEPLPAPTSPRCQFFGLTLDRFDLGHEARAAVAVGHVEKPYRDLPCSLPALLVGSSEGAVHKHVLTLPRETKRRKQAANAWCSQFLMPSLAPDEEGGERRPPHLSAFVGSDYYGWLRVLDVRGVHLLRFSIWHELKHEWSPRLLAAPGDPGEIKRYLTHLHELADEVYGRRPLTREPAKVIWEEGARVANLIARDALDCEEDAVREARWASYLKLNEAVDDLCNRWIGFEQAIESRVLIHTFNAMFDWVAVVLIALGECSPQITAVRRFLLRKMLQRRLGFTDPIVPLETLRNLNIAMVRAIRNAGTAGAEAPRWKLGLRPQRETDAEERVGLYDMLTIAGDLGERHAGSLTPSDPLWSELSRLFAAALILVPDSAFVTSQIVAESRLTERDTQFARAVLAQAKLILSQIGVPLSARLAEALEGFKDSFDDDVDLSLGRPGQPQEGDSAWRRLLRKADNAEKRQPPEGYDDFSNENFLLDHASAIRVAAFLGSLNNDPKLLSEKLRSWLRLKSRYFEHSRVYLRDLANHMEEVRQAGRSDQGMGTVAESIERATAICNLELEYLEREADLFEPQRSQYKAIVREWQKQVQKRAGVAADLLDILDKFNRHTYRASTDRLMSSITELALQSAPLWLGLPDGRPLQAEIQQQLEGQLLVREIFDSGTRLVASTHLAGTLLAVARVAVERDFREGDGDSAAAQAPPQTTLGAIERELAELSRLEGLEPQWLKKDSTATAPGTLAVWDTILQEVVTNVSRYCATPPGSPVAPSRNGRKVQAVYEAGGGRCYLRLAGNRPFFECLAPQHQARVAEKGLTEGERIRRLRELVEEAKKPGERLSMLERGRSDGSGMGLCLILRICRFLGMSADVLLRGPDRSPVQEDGASWEEIKLWPLCLEVGWTEA